VRDFPASLTFDRDHRASAVAAKVYRFLRTELDFVQARDVKVWVLAQSIASDREGVSTALSWLTECGYLVEHARGDRGVRRFTLAWSARNRAAS